VSAEHQPADGHAGIRRGFSLVNSRHVLRAAIRSALTAAGRSGPRKDERPAGHIDSGRGTDADQSLETRIRAR